MSGNVVHEQYSLAHVYGKVTSVAQDLFDANCANTVTAEVHYNIINKNRKDMDHKVVLWKYNKVNPTNKEVERLGVVNSSSIATNVSINSISFTSDTMPKTAVVNTKGVVNSMIGDNVMDYINDELIKHGKNKIDIKLKDTKGVSDSKSNSTLFDNFEATLAHPNGIL